MSWLRVSVCFLVVLELVAPSLAGICPESCFCTNTRDGLHRATCSNLAEIYKFTLRQKHHNINILDLSHNNITKLSHELDRLTEIVTLDLSTNGITDINKFLSNAKKLVHLNLANNRIQQLTFTYLPASVSSLDLTNNLLQDLPSDLEHLSSLEHFELDGNPLDCSCTNIRARDRLLSRNVFIDKVKCSTPKKYAGRSWLQLKTKEICKLSEKDDLDMMMGDQPFDVEKIGDDTTSLKSMALVSSNVLEGKVIHLEKSTEDDDNVQFMKVSHTTSPSPLAEFEGSGAEEESTTMSSESDVHQEQRINANIMATEEILLVTNTHSTKEHIEGSGEGSGSDYDDNPTVETTTPLLPDFEPPPVHRFFDNESTDNNATEYPPVQTPDLFQGGHDWHKGTQSPVTDRVATPMMTPDTTISETLSATNTKELESITNANDKPAPHKTGTYVCVAIIIVLLVGLIGFAIMKGQIRKRRDRRLLRQQKRDIEASKEMVDMNKSLLGKPAVVDTPTEKKVNGNYELVPTHEPFQKKENSDFSNGKTHGDINDHRTNSPRDSNQNKSSSKDHNCALDKTPTPVQDLSFESATLPDSKKDTNSLSSEDIFVPMHQETSRMNGIADSDLSQPLINGDPNTDSDFLSPSREYVPVYSPDMGRVRIKMSETPKPKTPVLVTRSRSNAGDIVITPSFDGKIKSTT